MYRLSLHQCHLIIRIGFALVFVWFGVNLFIQPDYWLHEWLPPFIGRSADGVGVGALNLMFLAGIFHVLVAISFSTGFFIRSFALAAALFLSGAIIAHGLDGMTVLMAGMVAALVGIALWPERAYS